MSKLKWKRSPGSAVQAPLSHGHGLVPPHDYVISHREGQHTVSYRPEGKHEHVGNFPTQKEAKAAAEAHARGEMKTPERVTGPVLPQRTRNPRARNPRKKPSKKQLDREIATSLASSGQPELAALFSIPEGRKTFAKEMRHEIQKQQLSEITKAARAQRPYAVKYLEQFNNRRVRRLFGNYSTLEEAKKAADKRAGWVEHEGQVIYGVEKQTDPA